MASSDILITGGTGFIGSHVAELLNGATHFEGDVRKPEDCQRNIEGKGVIIHLAGILNVDESINDPHKYLETNTRGSLNLLEAVRAAKTKPFMVYLSSANVYTGTGAVNEDYIIAPREPYAASKAAAGFYFLAYSNAYQIPTCILRAWSTYGPRQPPFMFVPKVITQCLEKDVLELDTLDAVKDFVYVKDVASAVAKAVEVQKTGTYNISTGQLVPLKRIVDLVSGLTGFKGEIRLKHERPNKSQSKTYGDCSRAKKELGWAPKYTIEEGLKESVEFMKSHK